MLGAPQVTVAADVRCERRLLQAVMPTKPNSNPSQPPQPTDVIRIVGARENNLRNVSVDIPKKRITVFLVCPVVHGAYSYVCLLYTSPSPRDS